MELGEHVPEHIKAWLATERGQEEALRIVAAAVASDAPRMTRLMVEEMFQAAARADGFTPAAPVEGAMSD